MLSLVSSSRIFGSFLFTFSLASFIPSSFKSSVRASLASLERAEDSRSRLADLRHRGARVNALGKLVARLPIEEYTLFRFLCVLRFLASQLRKQAH